MSTGRVGSLPSKLKGKKKMKKRQRPEERKRKKEKKLKKSNVDKPMCNCTWAFLSKNDVQFFPIVFSPF